MLTPDQATSQTSSLEAMVERHPLPIADAVVALEAAANVHEQRDRMVEVFRAVIRTVSAVTLATRLQFGPGPGDERPQVATLLRKLRRQSLTDGEWVGLTRELLRPWSKQPDDHRLPALVKLFHSRKKKRGGDVAKLLDELLGSRKKETVAHSTTGSAEAVAEILERRMPALLKLLEALAPLWTSAQLVVALATPKTDTEHQQAWRLMGQTRHRGRWGRMDIAARARIEPGEAALVDDSGKPAIGLHPIVVVKRPSPDEVEEAFVLDGAKRRDALYLALPSTTEHRQRDVWQVFDNVFDDTEGEEAARAVGLEGLQRPYRGLSSFGAEHAGLFFGRDELVEAVSNKIRLHPFVTVTGPSGSGKTSLIHAGVIPRLAQEADDEARTYREAQGRAFRVVVLRPGFRPWSALQRRLAELPVEGLDGKTPAAVAELVRAWAEAQQTTLVLVLDQAEELFTLCTDRDERRHTAELLAALADDPRAPSRVVMSVRGDFFARFATLDAIARHASQQVVLVTAPNRDSLCQILFEPARLFGYEFEDFQLIAQMVDAVEGEQAALALLQFTADRLWAARDRKWKRLTRDAYEAAGGVAGSLAHHADAVIDRLAVDQRREARQIFKRLVTPEDTRAVVPRQELVEAAHDPKAAAAVLDSLVDHRLLNVMQSEEEGEAEAQLELVHETLLSHWKRLEEWRDADREDRRRLSALRTASHEWEGQSRSGGLLWRDDVLTEHRAWQRRAEVKLTHSEQAFIDAADAADRRRRRLRNGLITAAIVILTAAALVLAWQRNLAVEAQGVAERQTAETERARAATEARGLVAEARSAALEGRRVESAALLRAAVDTKAGEERWRQTVVAELSRQAEQPLARVITGAPGQTLARSADGSRLVTSHSDGSIRIVDPNTGRLEHELTGHRGHVTTIALSPDGRSLASGSADATVRIWDVAGGDQSRIFEDLGGPVLALAYSPDGTRLAACFELGALLLWEPSTGREIHRLAGPDEDEPYEPGALRFSPDGTLLAMAGTDGTARVWSTASGELRHTFSPGAATQQPPPSETVRVQDARFSPDGTLLATASDAGVHLWDLAGGTLRHDLGRAGERGRTIAPLAFSADGGLLAAGATGVRVWETASARLLHTIAFDGNDPYVRDLAFAHDSPRLVAASTTGEWRLWQMPSGEELFRISDRSSGSRRVAFAPDDETLDSRSADGDVALWDLPTGRRETAEPPAVDPPVLPDGGVADGIDGGAVAADGGPAETDGSIRPLEIDVAKTLKRLKRSPLAGLLKQGLSWSWLLSPRGDRGALEVAGEIAIFDARSQKTLSRLSKIHDPEMAFSADGRHLATSTHGEPIDLWEVATGEKVGSFPVEGWCRAVALSADAGRLACTVRTSERREVGGPRILTDVHVWDRATSKRLFSAKRPTAGSTLRPLVFSADGKRLVAAGSGQLDVYDSATGVSLHKLAYTSFAHLSADGERAALEAGRNGPYRIIDLESGEVLRRIEQDRGRITRVAFSPDNGMVACGTLDGTTLLMRPESGELLHELRGPEGIIMDLLFSRDGSRTLVRTQGHVHIFDSTTGALVTTFGTAANDPVRFVEDDLQLVTVERARLRTFRLDLLDVGRILRETGSRTNLRVCRESFAVVAVLPYPAPETVWATDAACREAQSVGGE